MGLQNVCCWSINFDVGLKFVACLTYSVGIGLKLGMGIKFFVCKNVRAQT